MHKQAFLAVFSAASLVPAIRGAAATPAPGGVRHGARQDHRDHACAGLLTKPRGGEPPCKRGASNLTFCRIDPASHA